MLRPVHTRLFLRFLIAILGLYGLLYGVVIFHNRVYLVHFRKESIPAYPCAWQPTLNATVPKIIHQSWKTKELPTKFEIWHTKWKELHPEWQVKLWTDEDNRHLVAQHFPWFLETYDELKLPINRADVSRCMYLYKYGGVYVDLDMEPLKPLDNLLLPTENDSFRGFYTDPQTAMASRRGKFFLAKRDETSSTNIPNAFMASVPGHPFWLSCLHDVIRNHNLILAAKVEEIAGPDMLTDLLQIYLSSCPIVSDLTLLSPSLVYPYSWYYPDPICSAQHLQFNPTECKKKYPDAFMITYWSHTWSGVDGISIISEAFENLN